MLLAPLNVLKSCVDMTQRVLTVFSAVSALVLSQAATAATETTTKAIAATPVVAPVGAETIMSVLFGLLGIVALILGLAWFAKRAGATGWSRSSDMKIVATLALGTRERLLVVDIANTQILLGVTAQNINQLHVFDTPVIKTDGSANSDFSQKLMSIMKGQGSGSEKTAEQQQADTNNKQEHTNER